MSAIRFRYDESDLPNKFDAREKWTNLNSDVLDQGWCGASWAFSTASVASDRFVIDSKGPSINDVTIFFLFWPLPPHSSLVDNLAHEISGENCPSNFYCFFTFGIDHFLRQAKYPWVSHDSINCIVSIDKKKNNRKGGPFDTTRNLLKVS